MTHTSTNGQVPSVDCREAICQVINGVPHWQARSGRTFPLVIAGAEDPPPADPNTDTDDEEGDTFDKDRALATIRKQREREKAKDAELKIIRAEAAALKAKEQERADADKSELEKAQARLAEREKAHAEAEAKLRRMTISQAIERAARTHNARNPEVVAKLIDYDSLVFDGDEPTNAEALVKDLLKAEPYLVGGATSSGTGVPASPRSNGTLTRDDEVKKNIEELRASPHYQPLG